VHSRQAAAAADSQRHAQVQEEPTFGFGESLDIDWSKFGG
jgi:hypothetical protein